MKIAIIGSGGVGGYFGAKLAQSGNDVTFLARGAHKEAMQSNGLQVKSIDSDFHITNVSVTDNISDIEESDLVIIAVKAWQIKEVRNDLIGLIKDSNSMVLPLENGVMAADELREVLPENNILGGLCRIISKIEGPGIINHIGVKPTIVFGEWNGKLSERAILLEKVFNEAGIAVKISKDIEAELWKKFIAICVSALLAVTKTTYGEMRELKETRQMMTDLIAEIYELSQKKGINIEPEFVDKTISFIDTFPYNSTSSLTRDVWEGKPSEIEYQNGTVVKLAEELGVDVPVNRFLYSCVLPMDLKARLK